MSTAAETEEVRYSPEAWAWQRRLEQRDRIEREAADVSDESVNALIEKSRMQIAERQSPQIIRRTYETPPASEYSPHPLPAAPQTSLVSRALLEETLGSMAEHIGEVTGKMARQYSDEIAGLQQQIDALSSRVADLELEADARRSWFGGRKSK